MRATQKVRPAHSFTHEVKTGSVNLTEPNYSQWFQKWPQLLRKCSPGCSCEWMQSETWLMTVLHLHDSHVSGKPEVRKRLGPWSEERFLDWLKATESSTLVSKANVIPPPNARSLTDGNVLKLSADMDQTVFIQDFDGKQMVIMSLADRKWKFGTQSWRFQIQDDLVDGVLTVPEFMKYLQNLNQFADLLTHGGGQA